MSLSSDTFFNPPNKLVRRSLAIQYADSSSFSCEVNSDFNINVQGWCFNDSALLHSYQRNGSRSVAGHVDSCTLSSFLSNTSCSSSSSASSSSSVCFFCGAVALQPYLWSHLPLEIIERILAVLPVSSIFRFRAVCKAWRSLVCSPSFLHLRTQLMISTSLGNAQESHDHNKAYFLALNRSRYHQLSAYEVRSKKWYAFSVDFLPTDAYPVAAAKGLICFLSSNSETGYASLLVCNPLTKSWKELPSMLHRRVPLFISMAVDRKSMTYKILVAGSLQAGVGSHQMYKRTTEIYDSAKGAWILCESIPQNEQISRNGGSIEHCGYYLCLTRGLQQTSSYGLLAFSLQKQVWIKMPTGRIPGYSKFRHLVECGGSIVIVGKALRRYVLGLYIWCLDPTTFRWKEVGKMPRAICEQFFSSPSECFYCTAQGHLIFFCRYFYNQGLVYNINENSWQHVADCPLLTHPFLLPFEPGLDPVD